MRSPPKHNLSLPSNSHSHLLWTVDVDLNGRGAGESRTASILQLKNNSVPHQRIWRRCVDQGPLQLHSLSSAPSRLCCRQDGTTRSLLHQVHSRHYSWSPELLNQQGCFEASPGFPSQICRETWHYQRFAGQRERKGMNARPLRYFACASL